MICTPGPHLSLIIRPTAPFEFPKPRPWNQSKNARNMENWKRFHPNAKKYRRWNPVCKPSYALAV